MMTARMSAEEKQRDQCRGKDGGEHDNVENEKTAAESEKVGSTTEAILWAVDRTHRLDFIVHSNGLARYEVVKKGEESRTRECTDQPTNAQRRRIMEYMG